MISTRFALQVAKNVGYWQSKTEVADDRSLKLLDAERLNLFRAIAFGLQLPETQVKTAELALQLVSLMEKRGYWEEGITLLTRAARAAEGVQPLHLYLLNQLGMLYRLCRRSAEALKLHRQALAEARASGHLIETDHTHFHLGATYNALRDFKLAAEHANRALVGFLAREGGPPDDKMGPTYNLLGLIALEIGEYETAADRFQKAIVCWDRCRATTYLARAWNNLGLTRAKTGRLHEALACYDTAGELLALTNSELDYVLLGINRGNVYFWLNDLARTEAAFREAYTPFLRRSADRHNQALIGSNLGYVLLLQDRLEEAQGWLRDSVALWRELEDELMLASALLNAGLLAWRLGDRAAAAAAYDEAELLLKRNQESAWGREMMGDLAERRAKLG